MPVTLFGWMPTIGKFGCELGERSDDRMSSQSSARCRQPGVITEGENWDHPPIGEAAAMCLLDEN